MPLEVAEKVKSGSLIPLSSEEYEEQRIAWENATPGNLPGEHCPICLNKGYVRKKTIDGAVSIECRCMPKRRSLRMMKKSGLGDMLERYTFDTYQTTENWQQTVKQKAMDYVKDHDGKWFVAAGSVGSGKTHICTAICGGLIGDGLEVRYMLWRDHSVKIKAVVNDSEAYSEMVEPLKRVPVLYIDDFLKSAKDEGGKQRITPGDINLAFELINYRYNDKNLITIISTEKMIDDIIGIDEAIGSRIYERSKGYRLELTGDKNWRMA